MKSTPEFRRPHHLIVTQVLKVLDVDFLTRASCFFGGGTQLAMSLGEYRESRDIDFLCSEQAGYRVLREEVTNISLGGLFSRPLPLAREVRTDRDGIRTFIAVDGARLKFEIIFESRIALAGAIDERLGVPALFPEHAVAEKLLANADRGLDESTLFRDLIDLSFAAVHFGKPVLRAGLELAEQAYGTAARRYLGLGLDAFQNNRARAAMCIDSLAVDDTAVLRKGLRVLRAFV